MHKRLVLALVMAVTGAALLVSAALAGSTTTTAASKSEATRGGTLRLNVSNSDFEYLDPALAYDSLGWITLYATNLQLLNYPDKEASAGGSRIYAEGAEGMPRVSSDGKTYTFKVRSGLKFSDGKPVTAANFQREIVRVCHPDQASPAIAFANNIVGCTEFSEKKASKLSGVVAHGQTLVIRLKQADPTFLSQIAMPFFAAVPVNMPIDAKGLNVYASAGPYTIQSRDPSRGAVLVRNANYKGSRPANPDRIVFTTNTDQNQSLLQVRRGEVDYDLGNPPATAMEGLANEFGINKGRFFVKPLVGTQYMSLNTARPTFANVKVRQAANYAVDRPAILRALGKFAGKRTDQILAPALPGYKEANIYPLKGANPAKAKQVAGGAGGEVNLLHTTTASAVNVAQIVKFNLEQMGLKVNLKPQPFGVAINSMGTKGSEMDAFIIGWIADYPDPFDFINILLDGTNIQDKNNNNYSYWNNPSYNAKMKAAAKLTGDARYNAYGLLDIDIMKNQAPWVPLRNYNNRDFIGPNVSNYVYHPVYGHAILNQFVVKP